MAISAAITSEVLEAYLKCRYKAHLLQLGHSGDKTEYEAALSALREDLRREAIRKIERSCPDVAVHDGQILTRSVLTAGHAVIFGATLEVDRYSVRIDGLRKTGGKSSIGDFHYEPLLLYEGRKVREPQRLLLGAHAALLSRIQGRMPERGFVYHGTDAASSAIRFTAAAKAADRFLAAVGHLQESEPILALNDHCGICEFRRRCHAQAVKEDNLSLLRGR